MSEEIVLDDVLYRPETYLIDKFGELGYKLHPYVKLHNEVTEVYALMHDHDMFESYNSTGVGKNEIRHFYKLIEDDIRAIIHDHEG